MREPARAQTGTTRGIARSGRVALAAVLAAALLAVAPAGAVDRREAVPPSAPPATIDLGGDGAGLGTGTGAGPPEALLAWPTGTLTWGMVNRTPDLSRASQEAELAAAFAAWSAVTGVTFTQVPDCGLVFASPNCMVPDIRVLFGAGDHTAGQDPYGIDPSFDGPGGVAAHAFFPASGNTAGGDLHLDDAERWTTLGGAMPLRLVAMHEIGHALGITAHAPAKKCPTTATANRPIMCASVNVHQAPMPHSWDVNQARSRYGAPVARADAEARMVPAGGWRKRRLYNASADGQTVYADVRRGTRGRFDVRVTNDGAVPAAFLVTGPGSAGGKTRSYQVLDNKRNVTAEVGGSGLVTPVLAPGETFVVRVKVWLGAGLRRGQRTNTKVTVVPLGLGGSGDSARATFTAR